MMYNALYEEGHHGRNYQERLKFGCISGRFSGCRNAKGDHDHDGETEDRSGG